MACVSDKTKLASVCFFGQTGLPKTQQTINDGMVQGLTPHFRYVAIALLKIDPLPPADQLAEEELDKLDVATNSTLQRSSSEGAKVAVSTDESAPSRLVCFNCGHPSHRLANCTVLRSHCRCTKHSWTKHSANPQTVEYVKFEKQHQRAAARIYCGGRGRRGRALSFSHSNPSSGRKEGSAYSPITCMAAPDAF